MPLSKINNCPGTLAAGFDTYSRTCLKRMFDGRKVSHVLPYDVPKSNSKQNEKFEDNVVHISISGVQEKFMILIDKNKLRLTNEGERGAYILKPIPAVDKNADQMPANEHLTMQLAQQVFGIETAENALIFFSNGEPAYITKRFDVKDDGSKWAQDDFASLAGRTPQTHGAHYKYLGNYSDLFEIMKKYLPAYKSEAPKLFRLILFNYLFSNGDAHLKNFSVIETPMGDYRLSPAYDLLNSRLHITDNDFALEDGLLPPSLAQGKIRKQFQMLSERAGISEKQCDTIIAFMLSKSEKVETMINASFLNDRMKRNYWQAYQTRINKLSK
jgi:serine/threonine-protein kinase HipA